MHINIREKPALVANHVSAKVIQGPSLLDTILDSTENVIIFSLNENYCYTYFNSSHIRNMKKDWGVDIKNGMNLLVCISIPLLHEMTKASIDRALQGESFSEVQFHTGANMYYEFFWNPVLQNNKVIGVTAIITDITARKLAELALEKNEDQLKDAEIFAKFGSWRLNPDDQILYLSEGAQKIYGTAHEIITFNEIKKFRLPAYNSLIDEAMLSLIAENRPYDLEFKIKRKSDGKIIDIHSKAGYDALTNTVFGTLQDITEYKQTKALLEESRLRYQGLSDAANEAIFISENGICIEQNKMAEKLFCYTDEEAVGRNMMEWIAPEYRVLEKQYLQEGYEKPYEAVALKKDGTHFPCKIHGRQMKYKGRQVRVISLSDITETKFAEEKILQLSKAVEQSPVSVVITGLAGDIQYVNPKFVELTGYSLNEVLGRNPRILSSGNKSKKEYEEMWATISKGKTWHGEFQNRRKDGTLYWESAIISPILNTKGVITQFIAIKSDITESKKLHADLKESENVFRILFSETADAILLLDEKIFTDCNQAAVNILGYTTRDEIINCSPGDLSPKKQPDGTLSTKKAGAMMKKALQDGFSRFEWVHKKKDGSDLYVEVMLTSIHLKGKQIFYTLWRDITERKIAEEKLQDALEKYEMVNHATSDTIWEWDIKTKLIRRSKNFVNTYGYQSETMGNAGNWGMQNIHADDVKMLTEMVNNCIKKKQQHWKAEYRYRCADGTYKFVYDRAFLVYDKNGTLSSMYGAMTDLTEKQKLKTELAVQQLKQQKQLLEVNIQAQEEERNELGKELHDNISQMLATVKMYLGLAKAGRTIPEFDLLSKSYEYIEETITELRKLSHSLAPPSLGEIGLQEALLDLIHITNLVKDVNIKLVVDKKIKHGGLDKKIELMIYRIVQEQLNNINKYAGAKNVAINIKKEKGTLLLTITDDGVGFNMANKSKGIGLRNMSNRVEFYSGTLNIISSPGAGCSIKAAIPLDFNTSAL